MPSQPPVEPAPQPASLGHAAAAAAAAARRRDLRRPLLIVSVSVWNKFRNKRLEQVEQRARFSSIRSFFLPMFNNRYHQFLSFLDS